MPPRIACVQGGEPPLRALLADVLCECGFALEPNGNAASAHVVVLAVVGEAGLRRLRAIVSTAPGKPVLAILPFEDDALAQVALGLGASAFYALGTPLERLRTAVLALSGGSR